MKYLFLFIIIIIICIPSSNASYGCSPSCYVTSVGGSDSNNGQFGTPWATLEYAGSVLQGGDTLYLRGGTWNNEHMTFANSGSSGSPITVTNYPGESPAMIGDWSGFGINLDYRSYITINGLSISNYQDGVGATTTSPIDHIYITNNDIGPMGGEAALTGTGSHYVYMTGNTFHDTGWNTVQLRGAESDTRNDPSDHIYIQNNVFLDCTGHTGGIDVKGNMDTVVITGNTFTNVYSALYINNDYAYNDNNPGITNLIFSNNHGTDTGRINLAFIDGLLFENNDLTVYTTAIRYAPVDKEGIWIRYYANDDSLNMVFRNNTIRHPYDYGIYDDGSTGGNTYEDMFIDTPTNGNPDFSIKGSGNLITYTKYWKQYAQIRITSGDATVRFTDGRIIESTDSPSIIYDSTGSHFVYSPSTYDLTMYRMTARPTSSSITVASPSQGGDSYSFTISPVSGTPTVIVGAKVDTIYGNYDLYVDGVLQETISSSSEGIVTFSGFALGSSKDIVIVYSGAGTPTPTPTGTPTPTTTGTGTPTPSPTPSPSPTPIYNNTIGGEIINQYTPEQPIQFIVCSYWCTTKFSNVAVTATSPDGNISSGITGTDGSITFWMNATMKYTMTFTNSSQGVSLSTTTYPINSPIYIRINTMDFNWFSLSGNQNQQEEINVAVVDIKKVNVTAGYINISYSDKINETTGLIFYLNTTSGQSQTNLQTINAGGVSFYNTSFLVTNYNCVDYIINVIATHSRFGIMRYSYGVNFPGMCSTSGIDPTILMWFGMGILIFLGATAGATSHSTMSGVVVVLGWVIQVWGWLNGVGVNLALGLTVATVIFIISAMNERSKNEQMG